MQHILMVLFIIFIFIGATTLIINVMRDVWNYDNERVQKTLSTIFLISMLIAIFICLLGMSNLLGK